MGDWSLPEEVICGRELKAARRERGVDRSKTKSKEGKKKTKDETGMPEEQERTSRERLEVVGGSGLWEGEAQGLWLRTELY